MSSFWIGHQNNALIGLAVDGRPFKIASMYVLDGSRMSSLYLFVDKQFKFFVERS
jgi:hypothetical protein